MYFIYSSKATQFFNVIAEQISVHVTCWHAFKIIFAAETSLSHSYHFKYSHLPLSCISCIHKIEYVILQCYGNCKTYDISQIAIYIYIPNAFYLLLN